MEKIFTISKPTGDRTPEFRTKNRKRKSDDNRRIGIGVADRAKGRRLVFQNRAGEAVLAAHEEKVSKFRQQVIDQIHGARGKGGRRPGCRSHRGRKGWRPDLRRAKALDEAEAEGRPLMGRPAEIRTSASMARRLLEARLMQTQPTCLAQAMTWNEDQNNQIHETDMAVMAGGASLTCRLRRTDFRDLEVSTASEVAIAQKIDQLKHLSLPPMSAVEAREFFSWSQPRESTP